MQGQIPDSIIDMSWGALQHGVSPESLVALLNGNVTDSGVDVTPFKDLGGCLSRLGEEEARVGGPLTEAIEVSINRNLMWFNNLVCTCCEPALSQVVSFIIPCGCLCVVNTLSVHSLPLLRLKHGE